MTLPLRFEVPVRTVSEANARGHWSARAKRAKSQRTAMRLLAPKWTAGPLLVVKLTRLGPRELDTDNLAGSMKAVRDALADWLRVDDATPLVRWEYAQEKGPPGIRVEVTAVPQPWAYGPCALCGGFVGPDITGRPACYGCAPREMLPGRFRTDM